MGMRAEAPLGIALRGSSALQMWRSLALLEARALDERQRRWERGDFTHDALPELRASAVLAGRISPQTTPCAPALAAQFLLLVASRLTCLCRSK